MVEHIHKVLGSVPSTTKQTTAKVTQPLVPGLFRMALRTAYDSLHLIVWCIDHQFPWELHEDKGFGFCLLGIWVAG